VRRRHAAGARRSAGRTRRRLRAPGLGRVELHLRRGPGSDGREGTMSIVAPPDPPAATAWELVPLGRSGWRICDAGRGPADAERLVAYAEKDELGIIEVLWLRSPCPRRSRYRTM